MPRAQRLLALIQLLRSHRYAVTGAVLASELKISLRTLYRDIATLQAQGARIEGEPGIGYLLRPGFMLPPMMFSEEEIEALVLGSRWVAERGDARLAAAAREALAKINAVLPAELREQSDNNSLLIAPSARAKAEDAHMPTIRRAIRTGYKLQITYTDLKEAQSERVIWAIAIGFFDQVRVIVGWCELRQSFRHFRADRIEAAELLNQPTPRRRAALLKEWYAIERKIPATGVTATLETADATTNTTDTI